MREFLPVEIAIVQRATDETPVAQPEPPLQLTRKVGDNVVPLILSPNSGEISKLKRLQIAFGGTEIIPGALSSLQIYPGLFFSGNDIPLGGTERNNE